MLPKINSIYNFKAHFSQYSIFSYMFRSYYNFKHFLQQHRLLANTNNAIISYKRFNFLKHYNIYNHNFVAYFHANNHPDNCNNQLMHIQKQFLTYTKYFNISYYIALLFSKHAEYFSDKFYAKELVYNEFSSKPIDNIIENYTPCWFISTFDNIDIPTEYIDTFLYSDISDKKFCTFYKYEYNHLKNIPDIVEDSKLIILDIEYASQAYIFLDFYDVENLEYFNNFVLFCIAHKYAIVIDNVKRKNKEEIENYLYYYDYNVDIYNKI